MHELRILCGTQRHHEACQIKAQRARQLLGLAKVQQRDGAISAQQDVACRWLWVSTQLELLSSHAGLPRQVCQTKHSPKTWCVVSSEL